MSRTTDEGPSGNQPDDGQCVVCGDDADGIDAGREGNPPVCAFCAKIRTDGGVTIYECPECNEIERCNVDDAGQRRCPDCGRAVTAIVTDGGTGLVMGRRSRIEECSCGATVIGYLDGDPCPDCGEVIYS